MVLKDLYEFDRDDAIRFKDFVGIKAKEHGKELQFWTCPYCHGGKSKDKNTFSINLTTGQFKCLRNSCNMRGNMLTLAKDFNFELSTDVSRYLGQGQYRRSSFRSFGTEKFEIKDAAVRYMAERGISEDVTRRYEITAQTKDESKIVFPFRDADGVMRFVKYRNTKPEDIEKYGKEFAERSGMPILFGMYQCSENNNTLILTEGQIDSLSVTEAGFENAVSVPTGANGSTWIPHCWDWMQRFNKIIVFGDYERGQISLLDMAVKRFGGSKAIYHVRECDYKDCKDANDILRKYGKEQIAACINNAIAVPINGLEDIGDIKAADESEYTKLPTSIYSLDRLLKGGLPTGLVTLLNGRTGEGKSCFAHQMAMNIAAEGYKVMIYSGELPMAEVKRQIMKQAAGPEFISEKKNKYHDKVYTVKSSVYGKIDRWLAGKIYLYNTEITEEHVEFDNLLEIAEKAIAQYGVRFVVIDNLMTAIDLVAIESKDQYAKQGEFVNKLALMAKRYDVAILLVAHRRKSGNGGGESTDNEEVSGSSHITNLVGLNLFYGREVKEIEYEGRSGKSRTTKQIDQSDPSRLIKVTKNRLGGELNLQGIRVEYDTPSNRIYENSKDHNNLNHVYGWNVDTADQFEDVGEDDLDGIPF